MAEDRMETREINWRQWMPFTELFRGFRVALGFNKLLLAAAGIVTMAVGWYVLASIFYYPAPDWKSGKYKDFGQFKRDWNSWNLMLRAAGPDEQPRKSETDKVRPFRLEVYDLAETKDDYEDIVLEKENIEKQLKAGTRTLIQIAAEAKAEQRFRLPINDKGDYEGAADAKKTALKEQITLDALRLIRAENDPREIKATGVLATMPWFEDRGPNPYLMLTGQIRQRTDDGVRRLPWEQGHFLEWLLSVQLPVLLEPLVKVFMPVVFFFNPEAGLYARFYFLLVLLFTLATWSFFGGAITRIAAVEVARNEKIGLFEALRFTINRWMHFLSAPLLPLVLVAVLVLIMGLFGLVHLIPGLGDLVDGIGWVIPLLLGVIMAGVLIGLISWPMMAATISAEDEEALNAVSRSYSYVIQAPWYYLGYSALALVYGAVVIFFIGFMGSLAVYLAEWGVSQPSKVVWSSRDPSYLFVYAPTSFGWRDLLLKDARVNMPAEEGDAANQAHVGRSVVNPTTGRVDPQALQAFKAQYSWYNLILGSGLVSIWLGLFFLLVLGFGYSYFWSASTIIYLLMRKQVDDAELDEVYLEEEDQEEFGATPATAARPTPPPPAPVPAGVTMVEAPVLRQPAPPPPAPVPSPVASPKKPEEASAPAKVETQVSTDGGVKNDGPGDDKTS